MTTAPYAAEFLALLKHPDFVRATLGGTPRLHNTPLERVTFRPVQLGEARHVQVSRFDGRKDLTQNHPIDALDTAIQDLLQIGFANAHITLTAEEIDIRLTKKGDVQRSRKPRNSPAPAQDIAHNHAKAHLFPEGVENPLLAAMGILDRHNNVRPTMRSKFTQINEFLKLLDHTLPAFLQHRPAPSPDHPLHMLDAGCGASHLTLAAHHFLNTLRHLPTHTLGVDANSEVVQKAAARAAALADPHLQFQTGAIGALDDSHPDIVLALHACDTATDDAIAQAIRSGASLLLVVPCCHKFMTAQLAVPALAPIDRHGILHQRQADLITDAFRALILRLFHYRTDVIEFISPEHTARNLMIRAVRTAPAHAPFAPAILHEYRDFKAFTGTAPYLENILAGQFPQLRQNA